MINYSLHQFHGDPKDEGAWQAFVAANSESAAEQARPPSSTALKALYELFVLFVVLVVMASTILWQKSMTHFSELEAEVQRLQEQVPTTDESEVSGNRVATGSASALMLPPVLQVIETDFVRYVVELGNAAAIVTIAAGVDLDYLQLATDLGLTVTGGQEKLTVYIGDRTRDSHTDSPAALADIVVNTSSYGQEGVGSARDRQLSLYNAVMDQLARRALGQALSKRPVKLTWNAVIGSLYPYLVQEQPPHPIEALQTYELQHRYLAQTQIVNSARVHYEPGSWMYPGYTLAYEIADPLVEYIIATYGRGCIPDLLDALSTYDDWAMVAPTTFSVSLEEFETAWHAYLQQHYPLDPIRAAIDQYDPEPSVSNDVQRRYSGIN